MWLLPDEETAHLRGGFLARGVGHLHPTHTLKALSHGNLAGYGFYALIPAQRAVQHRGVIPKWKPGLVPPYHLHVELAEPRVVGQSRLLGWRTGGTLNGQQPLTQHDAALQFLGALVLAVREIDGSPLRPELLPVLGTFRLNIEHSLFTLHS